MAVSKKVIILNETSTGAASGIVKINTTKTGCAVDCSTANAVADKAKLLIKTNNQLLQFNLSAQKQTFESSGKLGDVTDCIITDGSKILMYGSSTANKIRCFSLLDEYKNSLPDSSLDDAEIEDQLEDETDLCTDLSESDQPSNPPESLADDKEIKIKAASQDAFEDSKNSEELKNAVAETQSEPATTEPETGNPSFVFDSDIPYEGDNFYLAVKPQLDEMFICYPEERELTAAVPNSRWVRVNCEEDFYVVGIISEIDEPKYICYGISGNYSVKPPAEMEKICDWLPLELDDKFGKGYWMIYQDAKTGKTVSG